MRPLLCLDCINYNDEMTSAGLSATKYDMDWFKRRAFNSIKKIENGVWDFSDSLLLWSPTSEKVYETIQEAKSPYYSIVTEPEREFLVSIADSIAKTLPENFEYVDLGPGTAHKEQFLFDALNKIGKKFTYTPVDISNHFLDIAHSYAEEQGIPTRPFLMPFEEVSNELRSYKPIFVSLGLTYINYKPAEALNMLKEMMGTDGIGFIDAQIRERTDIDRLVDIYKRDVYSIPEPKIILLGLNPQRDVEKYECDDGVRGWITLRNTNKNLQKLGVKPGDKLLTFQSLRPSLAEFEADISKIFERYQILDNGGPFVGALLEG